MQVATKPIFPLIPGDPAKRGFDVPPSGQGKDQEQATIKSQRRAKTSVRDMALCNPFEYFFTWTLDPGLIDRCDPEAVYKKVRNFLSNAVRRKGFQYVLVPEFHKKRKGEDKPAIHMHGLCCLGSVPIERAKTKTGRARTDKHGRPVFNMPTWKLGFSTCVPIDDQYERTVNYITKYITKANAKIFGKWYLHSRDLVKGPEKIPLESVRYDQFRDEDKLKAHIQCESSVYGGLKIISGEFPWAADPPN